MTTARTGVKRLIVSLIALLLLTAFGQAQPVTNRVFTLDADFDQGTLINLNHDAPNHDQLQLNVISRPFPFVNIAASARGTAIRIDVNTGQILGEYWTSPSGMARDPSRTTVDKFGNVWVTNRAEASDSGGYPKGSVVRIGLIVGGTRVDSTGTPESSGEYLKPPFTYSTCVDRNKDGLIRTSRGLSNILAWPNTGGVDTDGGVSTAEDECIINYTRVRGTNARTVAVDALNDVWIGGYGNRMHEKLSGETGQPIENTLYPAQCGGYGGLVDSQGTLWSAGSGYGLLRFVPGTITGTCYGSDHGTYGLGRDPVTGNIWHSSLGYSNTLYEIDKDGNVLNGYVQPFGAQGVVVDGNQHVWMAELFGSRIWHLKPDPDNPGKHVEAGIVTGLQGVTGVAVDANGKIWAAEINGSRASRIDPSLNGGVGGIDLTVSLGAGASPYNYSDMTGFVAIGGPAPSGTWDVIHDSTADATEWGKFKWTASTPEATGVTVEVRAADNLAQLPGAAFKPVANNGSVCGQDIRGRYLEVRTTLSRTAEATAGPVLFDLTISGCDTTPPVINGMPSACTLWPANHKMVQAGIITAEDSESGVSEFEVTVTSNEPENGLGDGDTSPDIVVSGTGIDARTVNLRAERSGTGQGRAYTITATVKDSAGNTATQQTICTVPHDLRK